MSRRRQKAARWAAALLILAVLISGGRYLRYRQDLIVTGQPRSLFMYRNLERLSVSGDTRLGSQHITFAYYDPENRVIQIGYTYPEEAFYAGGFMPRETDIRVDGAAAGIWETVPQGGRQTRRASILLRDVDDFAEVTITYAGACAVIGRK